MGLGELNDSIFIIALSYYGNAPVVETNRGNR
jgi:hypothetical protein